MMTTTSKVPHRNPLVAICLLATAFGCRLGRAEEPAVPPRAPLQGTWPLWSTPTTTNLTEGYQVADTNGVIHGFRLTDGSPRELQHISTDPSNCGFNGETSASFATTVDTSTYFGRAEILVAADGVLHAFYIKSAVVGGGEVARVFHATKSPGAAWGIPAPISLVGSVGSDEWRETFTLAATSYADGTAHLLCYWVQRRVNAGAHYAVLWRYEVGVGLTRMADDSANPGFGEAIPTLLSAHKGHAIWAMVPEPGADKQIRYYTPTSALSVLVLSTPSNNLRFGRAALFMTATGSRIITYSDSTAPHGVYYKVDTAAAVEIPGAIDAVVFDDASGVRTCLATKYTGTPASMHLSHAVLDPTTGLWSSEALSPIEHGGIFTTAQSAPPVPDWPYFRAVYEDSVGQFHITLGRVTFLSADTDESPRLKYTTRDDNLGEQNDLMMFPIGGRAFANLGNGNVHLQIPLFAAHGHGPIVESTLYYNSLSSYVSGFGRGWSHTYSTRIEVFPNHGTPEFIAILLPSGQRIVCNRGTGSYASEWLAEDKYGVSLRVIQTGGPTSPTYEVRAVGGGKWRFNGDGRLIDVTDLTGRHLTFTYSNNTATAGQFEQNLTVVADGYGRSLTFDYDANNRVTLIHDPAGSTYALEHDAGGQILSIRLPVDYASSPRKWQFTYHDSTGPVSSLPGFPASATLDGLRGCLATIQSPMLTALGGGAEGMNYHIGYYTTGDWYGRMKAAWTPSAPQSGTSTISRTKTNLSWSRPTGVETQFKASYDIWSYGDLSTSGVFDFYYDSIRCLPVRIDDPQNLGATEVTEFVYDARRNPTSVKDPGGKTTVYTYSRGTAPTPPDTWLLDLQTSVKFPNEDKATQFEYDSDGVLAYVREREGTGTVTEIVTTASSITMRKPAGGPAFETLLDSEGRITTQREPGNRELTYGYTGATCGLPTSIEIAGATDPDGNAMRVIYTYNDMGQLLTETMPGLGTTTYLYDLAHRLTKTIHPSSGAENAHTYGYDADDQLLWISDGSGPEHDKEFVYSARGEMLEAKDADGVPTKYVHNARGDIVEVNGRNPADKISIVRDLLGRPVSATKVLREGTSPPVTLTTSVTLNASGDPLATAIAGTTVDGASWTREIEYHYGGPEDGPTLNGLLLWERHHAGGTNLMYRHYYYDAERRIIAQQIHDSADAFFRGFGFTLDSFGRATEVWELSADYGSTGVLAGKKTVHEYDDAGNMTKRISPGLKATLFYYDSASRLTKTIDPSGVSTEYVYTAAGLLIGERYRVPGHGFQMPVKNQYNARGQLWRTSDCVNPSDYFVNTYDVAGRLVGQTGPDGFDVSYFYNTINQLTKQEVRASSSTTLTTKFTYNTSGGLQEYFMPPGTDPTLKWTFERDFAGRILTRTNPDPAIATASYVFDSEGKLGRETDEDGNKATHVYDLLGRLITSTYEKKVGGSLETWDVVTREWDVAGNLTAIQSTATGIRIEYQYKPDAGDPHLNDLRKVTWKIDGVVWKTVRHDYDADGHRTKTTIQSSGEPDQVFEMTYDPAGRLLSVKVNGTTSATYTYTDGFLTSTSLGNGNTILRYYDKKGRVEELRHKSGGALLASVTYEYDKRDRLVQAYYSHRQLRSTFDYNDAGWLISEDHLAASGGPEYTNTFATTYGGNEASPTSVQSGAPAPFAGGFHLQLGYEYDLRGNRLTKTSLTDPGLEATYEYSKDNRLTTEIRGGSTITYGYGQRGDLLTRTVGGSTTTYENDHLARMTKLVSPSETWSYKYSPAGQRVMKSKTAPASGVEEWVLSDGDETLAEYSGASAAAATLSGVYANAGTDSRAARYTAAGAGTYFWADRLGTVLQLTNDDGDEIRTTFSDAWGNNLAVDDPPPPVTGIADRWSFTGRERDVESGYMHFRARTYDSAIGRFLSQDPVWQHNLYYYANNSPTNLTDPFGRDVTEEDQRLFDMKFAEVERLEREQSSAKYGAAYADLLDFSVKLLARQWSTEYFDRKRAEKMLEQVHAKHSWIRGPYGEASKEHMTDLASSLGAARAEFDRFERADEIARVVLVSLDRAGTAASFFLGGGGIVKVMCTNGLKNGVKLLTHNAIVSVATGAAYNVGVEVAAEVAIAAGADPDDVEMAVRGLDATMSILNLVQGAAFRRKNNLECFVSGTPVETQDGPRPIEQVREGDWVLAWDEDAGELCWSRVEQTFVTPRQPIWRLTLKLPDGSEESLDCTPGHPFWADDEGWVPACHLQPGQDVATLSGPARVASVAPTGRTQTVYNFEVEGTHCYFVGTGGELVHNAPCGGVGPVNKGKAGVQKSLAAAKARGEHVLGTEVTFKAGGVRTRADILVRTPAGRLKVIEAKNGPSAKLSRNQKAGFPSLQQGGAVPVGANAEAANLTPGQALGPVDVQVDPWP